MKYIRFIMIGLAFVFLIYVFFVIFQDRTKSGAENTQTNQEPTILQWETKTDEQPPIIIKVTPVEFGKHFQTWKFRIVFDTHSGSLDGDLLTAVVLVDETGKEFPPIAWEGDGPGGHHREGVLVFDPISPAQSSVEIKIKNVGGVTERSLMWEMR